MFTSQSPICDYSKVHLNRMNLYRVWTEFHDSHFQLITIERYFVLTAKASDDLYPCLTKNDRNILTCENLLTILSKDPKFRKNTCSHGLCNGSEYICWQIDRTGTLAKYPEGKLVHVKNLTDEDWVEVFKQRQDIYFSKVTF